MSSNEELLKKMSFSGTSGQEEGPFLSDSKRLWTIKDLGTTEVERLLQET